ncbi:MAG: zf-HC2 domain-containing protein [Pyrinomonadaceae bacterium]|nr:zf-HC2 domain-containing protein [Pyrinomonadaceae bacterium]
MVNKREAVTCEQVRNLLDAYSDGEPSAAVRAEIGDHLQRCAECAETAEAHMRVKNLLQRAVQSETTPDALRLKIQNQIRANQQKVNAPFAQRRLAFAAVPVLAVLCVGAWGIYSSLHHQQVSSANHEASSDRALSAQASELFDIGLGDHIHCALKSGFANEHSTFEEMAHQLGADYSNLVPIVKERAGAEYEVVAAHHCAYGEREFVHLILRDGETILSLVITRKDGESFAGRGNTAASLPSGVPLYQGRLRDFEVAGFETDSHLAFIVSNLGAGDNLQVASNLAPSVRDFINNLEA